MGANSKARRDAKRKHGAARTRQRAANAVTIDMQSALRLWWALGAGEYDADEEYRAIAATMVLMWLRHANPDYGFEIPVDELVEMGRDMIAAGVLTRAPDGTVAIAVDAAEGGGP